MGERRREAGDGRREVYEGERGRMKMGSGGVEGRRMDKGRGDKIQIQERGHGSQDKKQKTGNFNRIREMRKGERRTK